MPGNRKYKKKDDKPCDRSNVEYDSTETRVTGPEYIQILAENEVEILPCVTRDNGKIRRSPKFMSVDDYAKKNVGVSVESQMLKNEYNKKLEDCSCFGDDPPPQRRANVRDELRNVIEMMGQNTCDSEPDDNDVSVYETSLYSSVVKISRKKNDENCTSYCEDSQMTCQDVEEIEPEIGTTEIAVQTCDVKRNNVYERNVCPKTVAAFTTVPSKRDRYTTPTIYLDNGRTKNCYKYGRRNNFLTFSKKLIYGKRKCKHTKNFDLYYKMGMSKPRRNDNGLPKRLVFDLVDLPKPQLKNNMTNTSAPDVLCHCDAKFDEVKKCTCNDTCTVNVEQKDIYYFDHGNSAYYKTTDSPPTLELDSAIEKTEYYSSKFWAQIFSVLHLGLSFLTSLLLQLVRFLLLSIVRPLTVGLIQLISDYFFKPSLAVIFNGIIQPPLIFLYNIATSVRDIIKPIAESVGFFLRELAVVLKSFRIIDVNKSKCTSLGNGKHFNEKNCKA